MAVDDVAERLLAALPGTEAQKSDHVTKMPPATIAANRPRSDQSVLHRKPAATTPVGSNHVQPMR